MSVSWILNTYYWLWNGAVFWLLKLLRNFSLKIDCVYLVLAWFLPRSVQHCWFASKIIIFKFSSPCFTIFICMQNAEITYRIQYFFKLWKSCLNLNLIVCHRKGKSNHKMCSIKSCSLKIRNTHKKTAVLESLINKACLRPAGLHACNFINKRLQHRWFPVNIAKS